MTKGRMERVVRMLLVIYFRYSFFSFLLSNKVFLAGNILNTIASYEKRRYLSKFVRTDLHKLKERYEKYKL